MISKFTLIIALLLMVHLNEYDVKAAKVIESSKIEKKLSKTASVLLASKEQKENDVPRSDDEDEKRSQSHKGYHTIKKSIGDLSLELAKVHILEATIKKRRGITNLKNKVNVNSEDNCKRIKSW
ncbi:uncharacterized protein LOC124439409 [Xenia sp. Carnegie-2017]|uniref:uncharacterized protein LOC124439409 n=1 Tax=Xenia sp. Carnegie-2017 TaxID=2897299 RepID=UPI001F034465|nr:uncharacterized protein LOC124439409 [Xenia sp. Carnegie-2017]